MTGIEALYLPARTGITAWQRPRGTTTLTLNAALRRTKRVHVPILVRSLWGYDRAVDATELREDVALAIAQMRDKRELRREIPELSSRATSHEHVLAAARARTADAYVGVLAVTDRRVLFVSHGPFRKKFEDFDMETVDNVSWAEGVLGGSLLLGVKGREVPYSGLDKKDGRRLSDAVRKQIST